MKKLTWILSAGLLAGVSVAPASSEGGGGYGMTWRVESHDDALGTDDVSCWAGPHECDAYAGDTSCAFSLPVLCFREGTHPDPDPAHGHPWSRGHIATTMPIPGYELDSVLDGNNLCRETHGPDWRMAEFHDGWGWYFRAYGHIREGRVWVHINDQPANCWD